MQVVFGGPVGPGQISAEDFASLSVDTSRALRLGEISVEDARAEIAAEAAAKPLAPGSIRSAKLGDLSFVDSSGNVPDPFGTFSHDGQTTALKIAVSDKSYIFIPQNILEQGWVKDNRQYYLGNVLLDDKLQRLVDSGDFVDISAFDKYKQIAEKEGLSTTGLLVPNTESWLARNVTQENIKTYDVEKTPKTGKIQGLSFIGGKPVYLAQPKGTHNGKYKITQSWIQAPNTKDYTNKTSLIGGDEGFFYNYFIPGEKPGGLLGLVNDIVSSDLFKIGSLALGAYGLYNLATAPAAAASAAGAAGAAGTGLTPGAAGASLAPGSFQAALPELGIQTAATTAGATAVPGSFAAALPGLVAPVGVLDLPSYGLLDETTFPTEGITADGGYSKITVVPPATPGLPSTVAGLDVPSLSAMGGGTGLTVPVTGGTVSEMGFVPTGATPSLGDPGSFINNPDYLGSPVISEDYLALTGADMPSGISLKDALDAARLGSQLLSPQQQMMQQGGLLGDIGGMQARGVSYAPLYGNQPVGLLPLAEQYRRSLL